MMSRKNHELRVEKLDLLTNGVTLDNLLTSSEPPFPVLSVFKNLHSYFLQAWPNVLMPHCRDNVAPACSPQMSTWYAQRSYYVTGTAHFH
jgi:hypothetical protein